MGVRTRKTLWECKDCGFYSESIVQVLEDSEQRMTKSDILLTTVLSTVNRPWGWEPETSNLGEALWWGSEQKESNKSYEKWHNSRSILTVESTGFNKRWSRCDKKRGRVELLPEMGMTEWSRYRSEIWFSCGLITFEVTIRYYIEGVRFMKKR